MLMRMRGDGIGHQVLLSGANDSAPLSTLELAHTEPAPSNDERRVEGEDEERSADEMEEDGSGDDSDDFEFWSDSDSDIGTSSSDEDDVVDDENYFD